MSELQQHNILQISEITRVVLPFCKSKNFRRGLAHKLGPGRTRSPWST
jgi:hypothetical protein